jgi:tetratricopeptide (TPR) repeat protein
LDGYLEDTVEICRRAIIQGEEFGIADWTRRLVLHQITRPQLSLGKAAEALQLVDALPLIHPFVEYKVLCLAHLHQDAEVIEILERRVLSRPNIGSTDDETAGWSDVLLLEAAVMMGHRQVTNVLLRRFSGTDLRTTGLMLVTCVARHLGAAAALLDRPEEARAHYQEAIKVCTEMRFRSEIALTRLQLAELLLEHYPDEKSEALEHLDFAINEFREMKMQPSLERALRHKEILGA